MKLKPIIIAILEELHMENKFVSLKFLINKLDKYKPSPPDFVAGSPKAF